MRHVFRRHFDIGRNGNVPTRQTILNWVTQFRTTAPSVNKDITRWSRYCVVLSIICKSFLQHWMATNRRLRTSLKCVCHSTHIFRCSYSSRVTRNLLVDNGCSSPELCNPIQYCLACRNISIPPDVKMSSKNTLRYSNGIIVSEKRFHSKRLMLFWPTLHDD